ncbi:LLM class flavin-dependent oxidoreductase [Hazenella sp. IB182357]|uniref:LLM class flavin-dependent oxidoreductase n=1 Tax=Polycladospora coralii TaxID=2771432 RepID=A0A926NDW4_9BACL|nr:LLM class flavin-dependent oxidoreductase [Polycladospora coralii]MBD1373610.1 LLM class flavin-dependent oxidoreductase [Polycladospora coralii]MBS7529653.1 LLM class flavin-dependent oxidoreductase [Polycladospora coralii]
MIKLSVLDQSPVPLGKKPVEALADTVKLAQVTEKLGYHRFWVAEHHYTRSLAGSSPEILIAHLAGKTKQIRLGSGGVMLPHYSAYKVAENFKMLEGLAPNRIDLGIGRAPGGMPLATRALQEGHTYRHDRYPVQIEDLVAYMHDDVDDQHRFPHLLATPLLDTAPEMWLLGSSGGSAMLAAKHGLGYAFAQFINGAGGAEVVKKYQASFQPSAVNDHPHVLLAIFVVCADTEEEAEKQASVLDLALLLIEKGGAGARGIPTIEMAQKYPYTDYDRYRIADNRNRMIVGTKMQIKEKILALRDTYKADEFMVVTITHDFEAKLRSYELVAEAFQA